MNRMCFALLTVAAIAEIAPCKSLAQISPPETELNLASELQMRQRETQEFLPQQLETELTLASEFQMRESQMRQPEIQQTLVSELHTHKPETEEAIPKQPQAKALLTQPHQAKDLLTQEPETQPAQTQEPPIKKPQTTKGFYGAISGDVRFLNSTTVQPIGVGIDFNTGYGINAALGYKFNNYLRLEGQFSYGTNEIGDVRLPGIPSTTTTVTDIVPTTTTTPLTIASNVTVPTTVNVPGVGLIPAGTVIPTAGAVLNPGTPPTTASVINVAPGITIPANTPINVFPGGVPTAGGTTTTTNTPVTTTNTTPAVPATTVSASGSISTLSGLINLYVDIPTGSDLEPYIGAGVGVSRASANDLTATYPGTSLTTTVSGTSTVFVYQLMAGLAYNVSPTTAVTLGYRYFNVASQSFELGSGGTATADGLGVNNIELGLRFRF